MSIVKIDCVHHKQATDGHVFQGKCSVEKYETLNLALKCQLCRSLKLSTVYLCHARMNMVLGNDEICVYKYKTLNIHTSVLKCNWFTVHILCCTAPFNTFHPITWIYTGWNTHLELCKTCLFSEQYSSNNSNSSISTCFPSISFTTHTVC